ncbi:NAD-binding protein [Natronolimnohabitans sp. A-GB9]|uniref:potassium channel family protein n=1 Tax=Natronolimnohabitans sp. A-GB9 TaxID=3069757 RepID=UPI0027B87A64|nr:NAD(P)-binding protein [Natronolimnohabitans sp. A-GB9]MDQ2049910.1 NAD-binding protein [Natronolimnohabitans sp. A-GB9]
MRPGFPTSFEDHPIRRRILAPIGSFLTVAVAGIVGFAVLGDVGLVQATFWLVDLTSIELHFEHHDGPERAVKAYAVLVTAGLVVSGLWIGETVLTAAFGGQIRSEVTRITMQRRISETDDHVIVCGYGMFGRTVANRLTEQGRDVVVIEIEDGTAQRVREDGHLLVEGDARQEHVLREAGIDRASKVVAAIDDSNVNIQIAIVGGTATNAPELLVRVGDEMYESVAREAGADEVVIPEIVSGQRVTQLLEGSTDSSGSVGSVGQPLEGDGSSAGSTMRADDA